MTDFNVDEAERKRLAQLKVIQEMEELAAKRTGELNTERAVAKTAAEVDKASEKKQVLAEIGKILTQYGGLESSIPLNSQYWRLLNKYRGM